VKSGDLVNPRSEARRARLRHIAGRLLIVLVVLLVLYLAAFLTALYYSGA
jgi:hypothetical protein